MIDAIMRGPVGMSSLMESEGRFQSYFLAVTFHIKRRGFFHIKWRVTFLPLTPSRVYVSIIPEVLESLRRHGGIAHSMLYVLVP